MISVLDYYKIGLRIRKMRKAQGLSQESLAEMVAISTTHMSHIETGNTKLSLAVLVELAGALGVKTDELLFDDPDLRREEAYLDLKDVLNSCSPEQAKIISAIVKSAKQAFDEYC